MRRKYGEEEYEEDEEEKNQKKKDDDDGTSVMKCPSVNTTSRVSILI
jgi:hypothetical protein